MVQKTEIDEITIEVAKLFPPQGKWTEEDYLNLPDTNYLVELSEGRLIFLDMPTTSHQISALSLLREIDSYVRAKGIGIVAYAPLPIRLWEGKFREPDIVFMNNAHRDRITEEYWGVPDLIVEVISRSTAKVDKEIKFREYAQAGVTEYWLVDPFRQTIEVFVLDQGAYKLLGKWGTGEVAYSKVLAGFQVAVDGVFGG